MSLKFEEQIVGKSMSSIPAVFDVNFFIFSIFYKFSFEAVVFNVVDCFQKKD